MPIPPDWPPYEWWQDADDRWLVHDGRGGGRQVARLAHLGHPVKYTVTGIGYEATDHPTKEAANAAAIASLPLRE